MKGRFLDVRWTTDDGWLTVWGVGVLLSRASVETRPRLWWTRLFRIEAWGWVLRLCVLVQWPKFYTYQQIMQMTRSEWADLDAVVLRASRLRMRKLADLNIGIASA